MDEAKLPEPLYVAVKLFWPALRLATISAAVFPASGTVAINPLELLKKLTDPDGVPAVDVTVAVSVTFWPNVDGFGEEARLVAVAAAPTDWLTGEDVEPLKLVESM